MSEATFWAIFDSRTGERVTVAAFLTEASAQATLEDWRRREARGGRPDVSTKDLYVGRLRTQDSYAIRKR